VQTVFHAHFLEVSIIRPPGDISRTIFSTEPGLPGFLVHFGQIAEAVDIQPLVLLSVFPNSEKCVYEFVRSNGLAAVTTSLTDVIITLDFYADFLATLVSSRQLEAIDEFILELRFDHPIH
jgi:hypothetical protein